MSKVDALRCDTCNVIYETEALTGVAMDEDVLDRMSSYKTISNPNKAAIHICGECFRSKVLVPAGNYVDRKKDEVAYHDKVKELSYMLRKDAVMRFIRRK